VRIAIKNGRSCQKVGRFHVSLANRLVRPDQRKTKREAGSLFLLALEASNGLAESAQPLCIETANLLARAAILNGNSQEAESM
jgi:hypothetical protein